MLYCSIYICDRVSKNFLEQPYSSNSRIPTHVCIKHEKIFKCNCIGSLFHIKQKKHISILAVIVVKAERERVKFCIDAQSSRLGSWVQTSPNYLPTKTMIKRYNKNFSSPSSKWLFLTFKAYFFIPFMNGHCASWIDFTLFCLERDTILTFKRHSFYEINTINVKRLGLVVL